MKMEKIENPVVIGLFAGGKRMGKTYTANKIKEALEKKGHKVAIVSFAGALRAISKDILRAFGIHAEIADELLTTDKDEACLGLSLGTGLSPYKRVSPREGLLVSVGQAIRKHISPDAWIEALWREVMALHSMGYTHMIIDDLRKPNEAMFIRQHGGELVYVTHPTICPDMTHEDYADGRTIRIRNPVHLASRFLDEISAND